MPPAFLGLLIPPFLLLLTHMMLKWPITSNSSAATIISAVIKGNEEGNPLLRPIAAIPDLLPGELEMANGMDLEEEITARGDPLASNPSPQAQHTSASPTSSTHATSSTIIATTDSTPS